MSILNCWKLGTFRKHLAMLTWAVVVTIVIGGPLASAEPSAPATPATKVDAQAAKPPAQVAEPAKPTAKPAGQKLKARSRAASKSSKSTPAPTAKEPPNPAASASQVLDFDNDEVAGKRLEPGFELIQGAPQRARQPSLVPLSPSPNDSVVNRN